MWIKTEQQKPEKDGSILIIIDDDKIKQAYYYMKDGFCFFDSRFPKHIDDIIYWHDLPALPNNDNTFDCNNERHPVDLSLDPVIIMKANNMAQRMRVSFNSFISLSIDLAIEFALEFSDKIDSYREDEASNEKIKKTQKK